MTSDSLALFDNQSFFNLETFRKDGSGVKTPLWFANIDGALYIRTGADSWKVKRLRAQPQVRITPSDSRGNPSGPWVDAQATIVDDPAMKKRVEQAFAKKYGLQKRLFELMSRLRGGATTGTVRIDLVG